MSNEVADRLFTEWLDSEYEKAIKKFKEGKDITNEDKLILTLKYQSNHFYHLDIELRDEIKETNKRIDSLKNRIDERFEEIDEKFEKIDEKFEKIDEKFEKIDEKFEKVFTLINKQTMMINNQTWRMLGGIGLIAVLIKLADNLPSIISFFSK